MSIKDALVRQDVGDRIEIGEVVKRTLNGKFGDILRAFINGMITSCLKDHENNPTDRMPLSADRLLGRAEAYQNCIYGLEQMVVDAEDMQRPQEEEDLEEE